MTVRRFPLVAAAGTLPLGGCAYETADLVVLGAFGVTGLFLLSLFLFPRLQDFLSRREHHDRMHNRRPFSPDDALRPRRRRHRKGA